MKSVINTNAALLFRASLFSTIVLTLLIFRNIWDYNWSGDMLSFAYVPMAISGQSFLIHVVITIIFLFFIWLPVNYFRWLLLPVLGLFQFLILLDGYIFNLYRFHLDLFFIKMFFVDFSGLGIGFSYVIVGMCVLILIIAMNFFTHKKINAKLKRRHVWMFWMTLLLTTFSGQVIHAYGNAHNLKSILSLSHTIPWYTPVTADNKLKQWDLIDESIKQENLAQDISTGGSFSYPRKLLSCMAPKQSTNILFVVLESWRFDRLNKDITPNIWKIGNDSLLFKEHLSGGNVTTQGLFSLLYGASPVYWQDALSTGAEPALISVLKQQGYKFHILANQDIEVTKLQDLLFKGIRPVHNRGDSNSPRGDIAITEKLFASIDKQKGPFFGFVFYNSSHFTYATPDGYNKPFLPARNLNLATVNAGTDNTPYLNQYSNSVHFEDALVSTIKSSLKSRGLWDDTVVIITGDHGEALNDFGRNYWGHGSNFTNYQLQVPLVVHWPGRKQVISHRTSHEDVAPTLMSELLGCSNDIADHSTGTNLFSASARTLMPKSYVSTAIVQGNSVNELFPGFVRSYDFNDVGQDPGTPPGLFAHIQKIKSHFRATSE